MTDGPLKQMRGEATAIFKASLSAANPYQAVQAFVRMDGDTLFLGPAHENPVKLDLARFDRISIVGAGKATAPMAAALEELLGKRIAKGMINVKYGFVADLSFTDIVEAGHPVPDDPGVRGTRKILEWLQNADEKDLIFSLISGGGSALLPLPAEPITLAEKQALTKDLLACGASIDEINAVRKHISLSKGGQMARAAFPATTVNLMLSDVVGDRMDVIASGPFTPDTSTYADVDRIIEKYGLTNTPDTIRERIRNGMAGKIPETPKPRDPEFKSVHNLVVGSNMLALRSAEKTARDLGYRTLILSSMMEGETRDVARVHAAIAKECLKTGNPFPSPLCVISGGETTVTIRGNGLGGRNQEFCLAAAQDIAGLAPQIVILSGGTDGNDGPTDAAGGIVDPLTVERGTRAGLHPFDFLKNNDAYHFLEKTDDLLITGPTNTNVMDVRLILVR